MTMIFVTFAAGMLAALSPCVLPVLPIMAGSSAQRNKVGPAILALGLVVSFSVIGLIFSQATSLFGFNESQVRLGSAVLLVTFGVVLLSASTKNRLSKLFLPLSSLANRASAKLDDKGLWGQFGIGFLLGAAWGPCVGPTLGVVLVLASTNGNGLEATLLLSVFGIGMAIPFLIVAYGFRRVLRNYTRGLININRLATPMLGAALASVGIMMISGFDKRLEAALVKFIPAHFFEFITSI